MPYFQWLNYQRYILHTSVSYLEHLLSLCGHKSFTLCATMHSSRCAKHLCRLGRQFLSHFHFPHWHWCQLFTSLTDQYTHTLTFHLKSTQLSRGHYFHRFMIFFGHSYVFLSQFFNSTHCLTITFASCYLICLQTHMLQLNYSQKDEKLSNLLSIQSISKSMTMGILIEIPIIRHPFVYLSLQTTLLSDCIITICILIPIDNIAFVCYLIQ